MKIWPFRAKVRSIKRSSDKQDRDLILFVHGLFGSPQSTWGPLFDLISGDSRLDGWDIDAFEFPSTYIPSVLRRTANIKELAAGLGTAIRVSHPNRKRIKIVAHSLGGIITRQYFVNEIKTGRNLDNVEALLLASPLGGSDMASMGKHISRHNRHLKQLTPDADALASLSEDWQLMNMGEKVDVHYVAGGADAVVYPDSALPSLLGPNHSLIPSCDHSSIVRPTNRDDVSYKLIANFILSGQKSSHQSVQPIQGSDPLFDIYHLSDEPYYLRRVEDDSALQRTLTAPLWISGKSGVGKTSLARRLALQAGWKLQHVMLGGYQADSDTVAAFLREAIALETGNYSAEDGDVPALIWRLKSEIMKSTSLVRCFLVEEIPVTDTTISKFVSGAVNVTAQFDADSNLRPAVRFIFTSLYNPEDVLAESELKARERLNFLQMQPWRPQELGALLRLLKRPTEIALSANDENTIITSANGMPRFVKQVLRGLRDRNANEGVEEHVRRLEKDGTP